MKLFFIFALVTIQLHANSTTLNASESKGIYPSGLGCNPFVVAGFIFNAMETWKGILGYNKYQVSNLGKIRKMSYKNYMERNSCFRTYKEILMTPATDRDGYLRVGLRRNGKRKHFYLHRVIAQTFIPNPENKPCINHKNGIKDDNRIKNLEWCTHSENTKHAYSIDLLDKKGEKHHKVKLSNDDVVEIRKLAADKKLMHKEIAKIFNISRSHASSIIRNEFWNHI